MNHRIEDVVARGMCIGCGACSAASSGAIPIVLSPMRMYQADLAGVDETALRAGSAVCPFSDESPNEDDLGAPCMDDTMAKDRNLGFVSRTLAGRVADDEFLMGSSSGGLTSWLLQKLIDNDHVDAVVSVGRPGPSPNEIFGYGLADPKRIGQRRKSQYYAATMADTLEMVRSTELRFALVGIPCFIRAARALCEKEPAFSERIVFFVGIVCGHYKTQAFAESLAWQTGIEPRDLADVDFRVKNLERAASDYDFGARSKNDKAWRFHQTHRLVGGNWGHSAFQPEACNFCDDVVGETSDVSFGDAWLPQFLAAPRGTNVVVTRNRLVDELIQDGTSRGEIWTTQLSTTEVVQSQAGGFRHRREGLSVRLADDIAHGLSVPRKRVDPDLKMVRPRRVRLLRQRRRMASLSHTLFAEATRQQDLTVYLDGMKHEIRRYRALEAPLMKRAFNHARNAGRKYLALVSREATRSRRGKSSI